MTRRSPLCVICALAALALAACSSPPVREVDASVARAPVAPAEPVCTEPTPVADFDAFLAEMATATAAHAPRGNLARAASVWDYTRARVEAGALVLDRDRARESLAAIREQRPGVNCQIARPRCSVPEGATCGTSAECSPEMWCDGPAGAAWCERAGRCRPRIEIGEPCPRVFGDGCAAPSAGLDGSACVPAVGSRTPICVGYTWRRVGPGEPCAPLYTDEPTPSRPRVDYRLCSDGNVCGLDGRCQPRPAPAGYLESCDLVVHCAPELYCDRADSRCHRASEIHCTRGPTGTACPLRVNGALVCIDGTCTETDGTRGAPCDPDMHSGDCARGLACQPSGVCGDLLPDGSTCAPIMMLFGTECASGCCAGDATFGAAGVCGTYGP